MKSGQSPKDKLLNAFIDALRPPPTLSVSEWAEKYRMLSSEASAVRGRWVNRPFQSEPMDCLSPSHPCQQVVLRCASQMLKTECALNFLGYTMHQDPGPFLFVEPRIPDAMALSTDRVTPMVRDTPELRDLVSPEKSRSKGNTTLHKSFPGGHVTFSGALVPAGLAMRPIRYVVFDEVDREQYRPGKEGDPISIGRRRTDEFVFNRKILIASSPTTQGSRIDEEYENSDQRKPYVPCPFCGHEQILLFPRLKWPAGEPRKVAYQCVGCEALIPAHKKAWMLDHGKWIAQNPGHPIPGFWISQLYSYRKEWGDLTEEWSQIKTESKRQSFINTVLAESWKVRGESPDWEKIKSRSEDYEMGTVPLGALVLTAGIDVQRKWLAVSIWGWGRNRERWLVAHYVLDGDTAQPDVWNRMSEIITAGYTHVGGQALHIRRVAIDTGDEHFNSEALYGWIRKMGPSLVMPVKGFARGEALVGLPHMPEATDSGKRYKLGVQVWPVNVSLAKSHLYASLSLERPEKETCLPGTIHFPWMGDDWYKQITAEQYETRRLKNGNTVGEWVKVRERNEALDCANYAQAAAYVLRLHERPESDWAEIEKFIGVVTVKITEEVLATEDPKRDEEKAKPQAGSWLNGGRSGGFSRNGSRWI